MTAPEADRPRIDLVSPLPPVRSGIADYVRDLLPHLARRCDLRLIRLPAQPVDEAIAARYELAPPAELGAEGRLPLYEMGNNRHHLGVLELAMETPGVLTLHDLVLHHLLVESTLAAGDPAGYYQRLAADHGWIGELTARARRWSELGAAALFELPANRTLLRRQRGVLVHSEWAAREVRREAGVEVHTVPMPMPLARRVPPAEAEAFKRRHDLPEDRPLLGSFGFQTPIKRTEAVIRALARPELADAHLAIVGEVSQSLDFEGLAARVGVSDRVHVTGFLDFDEFEAAIAACALCLNLRYPTAGETSASLLRVLAVGRPVVVSEYAQFAELPSEVAVQVPLGEEEVAALAERVGALLAQPEELEEMAEAARRYVAEHHDPELSARLTLERALALAGLEPPGDAPAEAPPPSTVTWLDLAGRLEVTGAEGPWPVGERRGLTVRLTNDGFCRWLATTRPVTGVSIELQWRPGPHDPPSEQQWVELGNDVAPGESYQFQVELRRPIGAGQLIVEPHLAGVGGFGKMGGPTWVRDVEP
ncbi:MAG: glycosyltransferase [Thermoanaerobaculia bacterium]|nr:glycosyltransferase [Thermoanaerobaculia bacterium]